MGWYLFSSFCLASEAYRSSDREDGFSCFLTTRNHSFQYAQIVSSKNLCLIAKKWKLFVILQKLLSTDTDTAVSEHRLLASQNKTVARNIQK